MQRCVILLILLLANACVAGETAENRSWTVSLLFENDLFGDSDEQYTNGLKISWISPDLNAYGDSERVPDWLLRLAETLPFINEPGLQRNVTLAVGQKIYTPEDIQQADLIGNDRPYAGWFYISSAFHNKSLYRLDTMEIQLGVIGPPSFAEQTQNLVHKLRGIPTAKGWHNQLDTEPGVALIFERKWRLLQTRNPIGFGYDVITHSGAAAGNVFLYANAGLEARVGWNLPADFGLSLIRPGGDASAPIDSSDPRLASARRYGAHLFAAVTGRLVGHDIFLDGNTFDKSHKIDKEILVGDFIIGASLLIRDVKLSYAQVFRSREFEGQGKHHNFGSLTVSWTF